MMNPQIILYIILSIVAINYIFDQVLDYLNLKSQSSELPDTLQGIYDKDAYKKSVAYHKELSRFSFLTEGLGFAASFLLIYSGGLGIIDEYLRIFFQNPILLALIFFGLMYFAADILSIPFQIYHTFVIEEKYGFNKTTIKTFVLDKIKGYLLTVVIGGLIVFILLLFINRLGENFWLFFWIVISVFLVFINMFYASLIVPLFNKLTPLEDGELKNAIQEYSRRVGFPLENIFVIDGSKRSSKANAFFFRELARRKKLYCMIHW